eukprot:6110937-Pleurochrysis_carterae.AAC.4
MLTSSSRDAYPQIVTTSADLTLPRAARTYSSRAPSGVSLDFGRFECEVGARSRGACEIAYLGGIVAHSADPRRCCSFLCSGRTYASERLSALQTPLI